VDYNVPVSIVAFMAMTSWSNASPAKAMVMYGGECAKRAMVKAGCRARRKFGEDRLTAENLFSAVVINDRNVPAAQASLVLIAFLLPALAYADFTGLVVGITDGDTISVMHDGKAEKILLNGIDCPEKGQAFGERANQIVGKRATTGLRRYAWECVRERLL
jgi:hypothetical protein